MDMNRIGALIRYDWMLHKHNIKLAFGIFAIIYICIAILYFISKSALSFDTNFQQLPQVVATFCVTFFNYANIVLILQMTMLVTDKFCYPRTATAYLTLPGTSLEKFCVVLFDYAAAYVALKVLFLIMFYLTMGVCYLASPELDWTINGFALLIPSEAQDMVSNLVMQIRSTDAMVELERMKAEGIMDIDSFITSIENLQTASYQMSLLSGLAGLGFYLVLNMLFKTNVQLKAIGCIVLSYIAYMVALIILGFCFLGNIIFKAQGMPGPDADAMIGNTIIGEMTGFLNFMTYALYTTPIWTIGLFYLFYYQICHKQAK